MIRLFERFGPAAAAVVVALGLLYYEGEMIDLAKSQQIQLSALYSSVFDWSSIQTGFLFGVFGFVSGKSTGFMAEVSKTQAMKVFNAYTFRAILLGFLLTLACIPLIVTGFNISGEGFWRYYIFVAWASLGAWSFVAFARVAYVFGVMLKVGDRNRVPG